jgi:hypothetical protein
VDERLFEHTAAASASIGRRSFGNFNPTIQKLHRDQQQELRQREQQKSNDGTTTRSTQQEAPMGLTAEEMASRYILSDPTTASCTWQ